MAGSRSTAKTATKAGGSGSRTTAATPARKPAAPARKKRADSTEQAKLRLLGEKVRQLRKGAEELLASAKRLNERLS